LTTRISLENVLKELDPARALRTKLQSLSERGNTPAELYELLERLLLQVREHSHDSGAAEDIVLDAMDALTGWCHPSAQLGGSDFPPS
jgi:hypothetical protein